MPLLMTELEEGKGKITEARQHRQKYRIAFIQQPFLVCATRKGRRALKSEINLSGVGITVENFGFI